MKIYPKVCREANAEVDKKVRKLMQEYGAAFSNQVVKNFLDNEAYYRLFSNAILIPSSENQVRLNQAFRQYYMEIRFTYYLSQVIWRYARDFKAKKKTDETHYVLTMDQPVQRKSDATSQTFKDQVPAEGKLEEIVIEGKGHLLERIENPFLHEGLQQLTKKQLKVLELYFVHQLTHVEIAFLSGVSQQAVAKSMGQALRKLRSYFKVSDNYGTNSVD